MTVAELIAELQTMPQDLIVILQKDSEGNGYAPLSGADSNAIYAARSEEVCTQEEHNEGWYEDGVPCVVLYP